MKKIEIVLATRNEAKVQEFRRILSRFEVEILSLKEVPGIPEISEDGHTFEENALKKAVTAAVLSGKIAIADDSGLEVDYLGGEPGVMSARYAGENATDEENIRKLLDNLRGVPDHLRAATFTCVLAVATPEGRKETVTGTCRGIITREPKGDHGFGYDPVFFFPEFGRTFAELSAAEKDGVSHRRKAVEKLLLILPRYLS